MRVLAWLEVALKWGVEVMERKEAAASDQVGIGELCHASVLERRGWRYGSRRRSGRVSATEETWHGDAKMIGHGRETPEWEEGEEIWRSRPEAAGGSVRVR